MKVGLIARAEDRGLGVMTHAFWRNMRPDKTLVVTLGELARGFPARVERYTDVNTMVMGWNGDRFDDEQMVRDWLADLDVLYTAETFYDWRIVEWCAAAGVATVLHCMPEFAQIGRPEWEQITKVWVPTPWRASLCGREVDLVPVPTEPQPGFVAGLERPHWVHVAGHRAALDRNGTNLFLAALAYLDHECDATVFCQDQRMPSGRGVARGVRFVRKLGGVADAGEMYRAGNALVMPRKYGGLSLPVQEAAGYGMALVLPAVSPNLWWPCATFASVGAAQLTTSAGEIDVWQYTPGGIADVMNELARNQEWFHRLRMESYQWAVEHSWDALRHDYEMGLREAAGAL